MVLTASLLASPFAGTPAYGLQPQDQGTVQLQKNASASKIDHRSVFAKTVTGKKNDSTDAVLFVEQQKDKLSLINPEKNLKVKKKETDELGMTHVKLQQTKNGIPVENSELIVHYDKEGAVQTINGYYNNELAAKEIDTAPVVSAGKALDAAKRSVSAPEIFEYEPKTDLVIYQDQLAYKVNLNFLGELPGNWFVFINAKTGEIVDQYNGLMHADEYKASKGSGIGVKGDHRVLNIAHKNDKDTKGGTEFYLYDKSHENTEGLLTYDFKNQWRSSTVRLPGELFKSNDASFKSDYERAGVDAHYNSKKVYDYYMNEHGRNSIDGKGMAIISTVHYGENYNNAFWNGQQMTYGDGDGKFMISLSAGLDVAAHEMTHGVTTNTSNLQYRFESGALNEAFSDIFGALIDDNDWEVGEDIMGADAVATGRDALRSLSNPRRFPVNAAYTPYGDGNGKYPQHMDEFYHLPLNLDNGGVHINSSIINHAAYLTGIEIGREKLGKIYYRALTVYLTPTSTFSDARKALLQSAADLYGAESAEYKSTEAGLNGVGIIE
ncbi:flagellar biosynthesis protein FlgM [Fictibacillus aquaticus]|uniref:Neutral metalloproteinase n=2 Tax=Fictibacillus aquaticus TaxID=2021314 RepID=A0A235F6D7_9BACL|nr:M4 family metallopeptidase [Fictibacillus aquaticus]OYD56812.1 flagellar biosynthesis protein FlgM [Fictibacillus aquaticus]